MEKVQAFMSRDIITLNGFHVTVGMVVLALAFYFLVLKRR